MQLRRFRVGGVACLLGVALAAVMAFAASDRVAAASASTGHRSPVTVHLRFRRMSGTVFFNTERYVFAKSGMSGPAISRGVLTDDRTGQHRQLTFAAGCSPIAIGAGALVLLCDSGLTRTQQIYDIATGQTRALTPDPLLGTPAPEGVCGAGSPPGPGVPPAVALGTRWVGLDIGGFDPHTYEQFAFQNLQTGQARCDPAGAHVTIDLDSAGLTTKPCAPLTVPVLHLLGGVGAGSLTPVGDGFEVYAGANSYLERCGTHLHQFLTSNHYQQSSPIGVQCAAVACPPPANAHAIIWPARGRVDGVWLPSRQRFTIPVPTSVDRFPGFDSDYEVGLTKRHLYLSTLTHVWQAPIPTQPARSRRPRSSNRPTG